MKPVPAFPPTDRQRRVVEHRSAITAAVVLFAVVQLGFTVALLAAGVPTWWMSLLTGVLVPLVWWPNLRLAEHDVRHGGTR